MRAAALALILVSTAAAAAVPAGAAGRCGVERQPEKTLTDSRAGNVNLASRPSSVRSLRHLRRPDDLSHRAAPVETTTYRIRARLLAMKLEDDSDVHLVIADPRNLAETMIAEFPSSACTTGASPRVRRLMQTARAALITRGGHPASGSFTTLTGTAVLTGVGFFDFKHGQRGVAPNAIELHPILGFR